MPKKKTDTAPESIDSQEKTSSTNPPNAPDDLKDSVHAQNKADSSEDSEPPKPKKRTSRKKAAEAQPAEAAPPKNAEKAASDPESQTSPAPSGQLANTSVSKDIDAPKPAPKQPVQPFVPKDIGAPEPAPKQPVQPFVPKDIGAPKPAPKQPVQPFVPKDLPRDPQPQTRQQPSYYDAIIKQSATQTTEPPKPSPQELEARYEALRQRWIKDYTEMPTDQQQRTLFNMMCDRVYWRIVYYMRRYPERLTSSVHTYSDRCIGGEEMMAFMGHIEEDGYSVAWLESNHVPPRQEAVDRLTLLNAQLHDLLSVKDTKAAIPRIMHHFALSETELEVLATVVIVMTVESLLRLMTVAWADFSIRQPTVSFLCDLIGDDSESYREVFNTFSEHGTLRRLRLIITERHALFPNYTPLIYAPLAVEQTVLDSFCARSQFRELPPNMKLHTDRLPMRALIVEDSIREELQYALNVNSSRICLIGPVHSGRRTLACALSTAQMNGVLEVDVCSEFEHLPPIEFEPHIAGIMREALLEGSLLLLRFDGIDDKPDILQGITESTAKITRLVENYPGVIVMLMTKINPTISDTFGKPVCIHIQPPPVNLAAKVWKRALDPWAEPDEIKHMSEIFSRNYSLPIGTIFGVVRDAVDALQSVGADPSTLKSHHILNEIRKSFRHQLGTLAEISVSDVPLSGVVLPGSAKAQVDEILAYANNLHNVLDTWGFRQRSPYGNALSALFAGPPGTGKTLLANALANELGKVLYRVDLSRIVDKYIGETEKNLGKIFDEAAKAQAIILFDEADSLFAKRTDVKSSNDRYANLEINYLLQKLESYNGITILTTNLSKSIDEAFRRRLRFIIDFPMPDVPARVELWKRMIPPNAPVADDVRWQWLARTYEMSGGYIRNAVLKAAITASAAGKPISMEHLAKAAGDEARSMGKLMRVDNNYDDYYEDDRGSGGGGSGYYDEDDR